MKKSLGAFEQAGFVKSLKIDIVKCYVGGEKVVAISRLYFEAQL